jgi:carbon monoxide dehydrogenase subunit G
MPRREAKFTVNARPDELWRFIRDFQSLCTCIPGVERIRQLDDKTAELTVKEKVGVVPLIVTLLAQIESEEPPRSLHAIARAEHLTMAIDVTLRGTESGTELASLFDVTGEGQLKPIVDRLFERRASERAAHFADCLERRFGAVAPGAAPERPRGRAFRARHWAGRINRWLALLWRRLRGHFAPPAN